MGKINMKDGKLFMDRGKMSEQKDISDMERLTDDDMADVTGGTHVSFVYYKFRNRHDILRCEFCLGKRFSAGKDQVYCESCGRPTKINLADWGYEVFFS